MRGHELPASSPLCERPAPFADLEQRLCLADQAAIGAQTRMTKRAALARGSVAGFADSVVVARQISSTPDSSMGERPALRGREVSPPEHCARGRLHLASPPVIGAYTGTLRFIPSAQQAADSWESGAQAATQKWATNLQNTTKPIVSRAVQQAQTAKSNYAQAIDSGRWANALEAVGDSGIKSAAQAKSGNYGTGISAAKSKYQQKIGPLLSYISAGLPQLESMPSGTVSAGVARATFWIQYMAGAKGL